MVPALTVTAICFLTSPSKLVVVGQAAQIVLPGSFPIHEVLDKEYLQGIAGAEFLVLRVHIGSYGRQAPLAFQAIFEGCHDAVNLQHPYFPPAPRRG